MTKLIFVVEKLELGGAESVALSLAAEAVERGFDVDVVALKGGGLLEGRVPPRASYTVLGKTRTSGALWALQKIFRKSSVSGIVSFGDNVNILTLLALLMSRRQIPSCVTVHSPYSYTVGTWPVIKKLIAVPLIRRLYPRATAVVCVSNGVRASLAEFSARGISRNVFVISNPVLSVDDLQLERKQRNRDAKVRFIFVGRLAPEKDLPTLVAAFESAALIIDAELLFFGEGSERTSLERLISVSSARDRMHVRGFRADLSAIYEDAHCLVLSSKYESFGNVLLEALAYGCLVVATDCPVGPREVLENGRWGALVKVGDVPALAEAMVMAARADGGHDPIALGTYLRRFSSDQVLSEYLRALQLQDI